MKLTKKEIQERLNELSNLTCSGYPCTECRKLLQEILNSIDEPPEQWVIVRGYSDKDSRVPCILVDMHTLTLCRVKEFYWMSRKLAKAEKARLEGKGKPKTWTTEHKDCVFYKDAVLCDGLYRFSITGANDEDLSLVIGSLNQKAKEQNDD